MESIEEADLSIDGDIVGFIYMEHDPIDIFIPIGLVIDLFTKKNYGRLEYKISVLDVKKRRVAWKRLLKATATEFDMPRDDAVSLLTDRAAYLFIKECFGKPKSRIRI